MEEGASAPFYMIPTVEIEGGQYVPLKRFFEDVLGIDWKGQRSQLLKQGFVLQKKPVVAGDGRTHNILVCPVEELPKIVHRIDPGHIHKDVGVVSIINGVRVTESVRDKLRRYQEML